MPKSVPQWLAGYNGAALLARVGLALAFFRLAIPGPAQTPAPSDLTQFSLDGLMNVEVTSVSRKEQKLAKTGAAIFVITQEDIHDSGVTNIPDALRIAPGVDVAQIDANH